MAARGRFAHRDAQTWIRNPLQVQDEEKEQDKDERLEKSCRLGSRYGETCFPQSRSTGRFRRDVSVSVGTPARAI